MVYIVGASSLNHIIKCIPYDQRRQLFGRSYSIPGLSFNPQGSQQIEDLAESFDRKRCTCQEAEDHHLARRNQ